jgi:hypothetical protein
VRGPTQEHAEPSCATGRRLRESRRDPGVVRVQNLELALAQEEDHLGGPRPGLKAAPLDQDLAGGGVDGDREDRRPPIGVGRGRARRRGQADRDHENAPDPLAIDRPHGEQRRSPLSKKPITQLSGAQL